MVTDGIGSKLGLFIFPLLEIRWQDDILGEVNTINNWAEVNYIVHAVPSTKHKDCE